MFLFIKIILSMFLFFLWLRSCKNDLFQSLANLFFILFIITLVYDVYSLNNKMITLINQPVNVIHLIIDRNILLPFSLFFLLGISEQFFLKFLFSGIWILLYKYLETLNEQFHIVELHKWTLIKWGYTGGIIIILSLFMNFLFNKLGRSRKKNAPSN